jgi:hypothetical protein
MKWQINEIPGGQNWKLPNQWAGKMVSWQNDQCTDWWKSPYDKISSWKNHQVIKWPVDKMACRWNGWLMKWLVDEMASWWNGQLMKWPVDEIVSWWND